MQPISYFEFSAWNVPRDETTVIPSDDMWLFDEPFRVTESLTDLQRYIGDAINNKDRLVAGIPAMIVFKCRLVTKTSWTPM